MYIWTGIDVDSQLSDVKSRAIAVNKELGLEHFCFTLPFHVSLKMSFEPSAEDESKIISTMTSILLSEKPFDLEIQGFELDSNIAWIRMKESAKLNGLHDRLCSVLSENFGIALHEYDLDYKFHTTLFMDDNTDKVSAAFNRIKDQKLPTKLRVNRFVIGTSQSGALGTYSIFREIIL